MSLTKPLTAPLTEIEKAVLLSAIPLGEMRDVLRRILRTLDVTEAELGKARLEIGAMRAMLEAIRDFPREDQPRTEDGYPLPVESVYDERAYRRIVDTYRGCARAALAVDSPTGMRGPNGECPHCSEIDCRCHANDGSPIV